MSVFCLWAAWSPQPAWAQTTYANRALWAAAAGPVNTETFEGIAPAAGYTAFDTASGLPRPGNRFTGVVKAGASYYLRVVDAAYTSGWNWGSGAVLHGAPNVVGPGGEGGPNSWILAATPVGTTAVGADIMSILQYASSMTIVVTTIDSHQYTYTVSTLAYPQRAFFGIVTQTPILSIRFQGLQGFPVIDNYSFGGPGAIGPPTITNVVTVGQLVSIYWTPPVQSGLPISGYQFEVASSSYGPAYYTVQTPGTSLIAPGVPYGTYFVRVRSLSGATLGPSSNEAVITVGACSAAPPAPTGVTASAQGTLVSASWAPPSSGCPPTAYLVRVGTTSAGADIGTFNVGLATGAAGTLPPGTYYVSVVALNGAQASPLSNVASVVVGSACTVPAAPTNFVAASALDVATLTWSPPAGPVTRYLIEVGSTSGAKDITTFPLTVPGFQTAGVQRGTYYLRVRAENSCGVGPASLERVLSVTY